MKRTVEIMDQVPKDEVNPPWFEDSDSEDDDWMSDSLDKYKHLFKYKVENAPFKIRIHPEGKLILLLSLTAKKKYEIQVFQMPEKILAATPEEEGLINNRELMLLYGYIESKTILDCDFAPNSGLAVIVLTPGQLDILKVKDEVSNILVKSKTFPLDKPATKWFLGECSCNSGCRRNG